jgi:hypothetical protein
LKFREVFQLHRGVQGLRVKIFRLQFSENQQLSPRPASSKRGVRVVTIRGVRDAVDVKATADGWCRHGRSSRMVLIPRRWYQVRDGARAPRG